MRATRPGSLGSRLAAVLEMVPEASRVADLGADHGLLARALLSSGRARTCVATEATDRRLERTRRSLDGHPFGDRLGLRAGWGLAPLTAADELDVIVVAGMGGPTIVRLLADPRLDSLAVRRLVLQPTTDVSRLRRWLVDQRLSIMDERLVLSRNRSRNRFHFVLAVERPQEDAGSAGWVDEDGLEAGPCLIRACPPELRLYWRAQLRRLEGVLARASAGAGRDEAARQRRLAMRILARIDQDLSLL